MDPLDNYYLVKDFARRIEREESTVRKWISKQIIPAVRLGSLYQIPKTELAEILSNNTVGALFPSRRVVRSIRRGLMRPSPHSPKAEAPRTTAELPGGRYVQDKD